MIVDKTNYSIDCFHSATVIKGTSKSKTIARKQHLLQILPMAEITGYVLEFGVYLGKTMAHISNHFKDQTVYGFDSFVGLPEPWHTRSTGKTHAAGKFDLRLETEKPAFDSNVKLVTGWFSDSIPQWKDTHSGHISFLHVDCDLYSSTRDVLSLLNDRIVPGTVIAFDEMYPWSNAALYDLWAEGEYRAVSEWLSEYSRSFKPLLRTGHQQCSIVVVK
jgi:hypothetical protein